MGKPSDKTHGYRYKRWQQSVFKRGNYTCVLCGATTQLTADHILPSSTFPEFRYSVGNGRVMCESCRVKDMLESLSGGLFRDNPRAPHMANTWRMTKEMRECAGLGEQGQQGGV